MDNAKLPYVPLACLLYGYPDAVEAEAEGLDVVRACVDWLQSQSVSELHTLWNDMRRRWHPPVIMLANKDPLRPLPHMIHRYPAPLVSHQSDAERDGMGNPVPVARRASTFGGLIVVAESHPTLTEAHKIALALSTVRELRALLYPTETERNQPMPGRLQRVLVALSLTQDGLSRHRRYTRRFARKLLATIKGRGPWTLGQVDTLVREWASSERGCPPGAPPFRACYVRHTEAESAGQPYHHLMYAPPGAGRVPDLNTWGYCVGDGGAWKPCPHMQAAAAGPLNLAWIDEQDVTHDGGGGAAFESVALGMLKDYTRSRVDLDGNALLDCVLLLQHVRATGTPPEEPWGRDLMLMGVGDWCTASGDFRRGELHTIRSHYTHSPGASRVIVCGYLQPRGLEPPSTNDLFPVTWTCTGDTLAYAMPELVTPWLGDGALLPYVKVTFRLTTSNVLSLIIDALPCNEADHMIMYLRENSSASDRLVKCITTLACNKELGPILTAMRERNRKHVTTVVESHPTKRDPTAPNSRASSPGRCLCVGMYAVRDAGRGVVARERTAIAVYTSLQSVMDVARPGLGAMAVCHIAQGSAFTMNKHMESVIGHPCEAVVTRLRHLVDCELSGGNSDVALYMLLTRDREGFKECDARVPGILTRISKSGATMHCQQHGEITLTT